MIADPPEANRCVIYISGSAVEFYMGLNRLYFSVPAGGESQIPGAVVATESLEIIEAVEQQRARASTKSLMRILGEAASLGPDEVELHRQLVALVDLGADC